MHARISAKSLATSWGILTTALLGLLACSPSLHFATPGQAPLVPLTDVADEEVLAWSPDSQWLAVDRDGLVLVSTRGETRRLPIARPRVVAWGAKGLAAASSTDEHSWLRLCDAEAGVLSSVELEGVVVAMAWDADDGLLALVARHHTYRFGTQQRMFLMRWLGAGEPDWQLLSDSTLKPSTVAGLGGRFPYGAKLLVSPLGDEVLYTRLYDAPVFATEYQVFIRHLESGAERQVASHPLQESAIALLPDGEKLAISTAGDVETMALWGERRARMFQHTAKHLAASTSLVYAAGRLYRNQELLWQLQEDASAVFSPDGRQLALVDQGQLYVVPVPGTAVHPRPSARRLALRRLRALGLITDADYQHYGKEE